jgi:hypothetical protein
VSEGVTTLTNSAELGRSGICSAIAAPRSSIRSARRRFMPRRLGNCWIAWGWPSAPG